ncbi:glutamate receptor ionotropic, delta-2-like [Dermacentor silvarum]|uniref:glutamate receptor ionotropic, delta-2-like n=1 Tax=Dermacentor silvarum TaxID=543639 RepID=UPI002101C5C2|nr:glutamate receptor ionotropic, delta-2-like [Dermacentor silvarum]
MKENQVALYSLRSFGNGSTCWNPVTDPTTQLFEPYPNQLFDRTLRVVSLGLYPVRKEPEGEDDWRWSGFVFDVLNCLADSLHFRYQSRDPEHHYYFAQLPNGSYVGVIGDVARKVADVAVGDLSRTTARDALVDFTTLILDDAVTFVYYRGTSEPGLWTVLKPFPLSVWALTFSAMLLLVTLLYTYNVARAALRTLDDTTTCSRRVLSVAKSVLHSYLTQDKPHEEGPRPLLGCWYVVFLVLTTVYCGRLTAFYVTTLEEPCVLSYRAGGTSATCHRSCQKRITTLRSAEAANVRFPVEAAPCAGGQRPYAR